MDEGEQLIAITITAIVIASNFFLIPAPAHMHLSQHDLRSAIINKPNFMKYSKTSY